MSGASWRPTPEALERALKLHDRILSREEFVEGLAVPLSHEELENNRDLIRWFRTRYPTPAERLAYVRQAYRRWKGGVGG